MFSWLASYFSKPIIFEVEKPYDEVSRRRIKFFERLNVCLYDVDYVQPSYHGGSDKIEMFIASFSHAMNLKTINGYVDRIKKEVYNLK